MKTQDDTDDTDDIDSTDGEDEDDQNAELKYQIQSGFASTFNKLKKIDSIDDLIVSEGTGFLEFKFPINFNGISLKELTFTIPTVVTTVQPGDTPCDGDITSLLSIDKNILKEALLSLRGIPGGKHAVVSLDSTQSNRLVIKVSDDDSNAKNVIVDARIFGEDIISMKMAPFASVVAKFKDNTINIGTIPFQGEEWLTLTPMTSHHDEELNDTYRDIVITIRTEKD